MTKTEIIHCLENAYEELQGESGNEWVLIAQIPMRAKKNNADFPTKQENPEVLRELFGEDHWKDILPMIGFQVQYDDNAGVHKVRKPQEAVSEDSLINTPPNKPENRYARIKGLLEHLGAGLYEKEAVLRLGLLSAVAGESMFLLGPPGTAKSLVCTRIKEAFGPDATYFEQLMNEFSSPDEIFGTIKLKGLDEGIHEKNTEGYLPKANIAFLDEIWKSGPAILNTLLTIINERKFRNGTEMTQVPLQALFAASNELPREKAGLEALYDRFIVRMMVRPIASMENFFAMCEGQNEWEMPENTLSIEEVREWQKAIRDITLDDTIKNIIIEIRRALEIKNRDKDRDEKDRYYISDRRWKKIVHILKTSAFLCGRPAVDLMDCQLLTYCIWSTEKQQREVADIVEEIVQQHGLEAETAIEDIEDQIERFRKDIDETFYVWQETHKEPMTKKDSEGRIYYKVAENNFGIGYITKGAVSLPDKRVFADADFSNLRYIEYYADMNPETFIMKHTQDSNRDIKIATKTVTDSEPILVKNNGIFNNANAHASTKKEFNEGKYQPIAASIHSELQRLDEFRSDIEKPYSENLFAQQDFKEVITSKLEEQKKRLQDAQIALDKQKNRYEG